MAHKKYKKLPKKPKASASLHTLIAYENKVKEIAKENALIKKHNDELDRVKKRIAGVTTASITPKAGISVRTVSGTHHRSKKAATVAGPHKRKKTTHHAKKRR